MLYLEKYGRLPKNHRMNFYYNVSDNIRKFIVKKETSKFNSCHLS